MTHEDENSIANVHLRSITGETREQLQEKDKSKKCLVHGCTNFKEEGGFVGDLCVPCYSVITTGRVDVPGDTFINKLARESMISKVSVFQDWLFNLTMQQQSVLVLACRGPDNIGKFHQVKQIVTRYRASVLKAAYLGRPMFPGEGDDTTFMTMEGFDDPEMWHIIEQLWFEHLDEAPHHYIMHLVHGAQIIGYKHPEALFRDRWLQFYLRSCHDLHFCPETEDKMDERLNDWDRQHWDSKTSPVFTSTKPSPW